ncbi:MAG: YbaB/EbfC family nucleoid-associated protein [Ferrovum sp.]|nr:YbaB/EbfC family nucleoid-associated protein [Ferrovum sp.]NDU87670.1 YbaB/EbfC family nucleoid-associated protein [Ferrovum sp.]
MLKGGIAGLMKQAQKVQDNMRRAQEELAQIEVEGQAGAGAVKIRSTCTHEIRQVQIDESLMTDREMLEDLLRVALNDLNRHIDETTQKQMAGMTGGLNLPPGMKLPF